MQCLFHSATFGMFEIVRTFIISETITESTFKVRFLDTSRLYHTGIYSIKGLKSTQMKRVWYYKNLIEGICYVCYYHCGVYMDRPLALCIWVQLLEYDLNDT